MPRLFISPLYRYRCSFFYLIIIATSAPTSPPDRVDTALVKICPRHTVPAFPPAAFPAL